MRLYAIAAAGLAVRLAYILGFTRHLRGTGDSAFFSELGNLIGSGHGFVNPIGLALLHKSTPTALHPPLFPLVLGLGSWLGLDSYLAQRVIVAVIGACSVVAVGVLGRKIGGERAGLVAAGLAAVYPVLVSADGAVMSETLYGLLVVLAVIATYRVLERGSWQRGAVLGALIGLAALTRAEALLLVLLLAAPAARRAWPTLVAALLTCLLVLVPWTIRNAIVFDRFVLISNNSGTLVAGANCNRTYHGPLTGSWNIFCVRGMGRTDNEAVAAAGQRRAGLDYASDHGGRVPAVMGIRVLRTFDFWQPWHEARVAEARAYRMEVAGAIAFWLLAPLGVAGAVLLRRRGTRFFPLAAPFVLALAVSLGGYGLPRFRHPADLALVVLAAVAIEATLAARSRVQLGQAPPEPLRARGGDGAARVASGSAQVARRRSS